MRIDSPFPADCYDRLWAWLNEWPERNFDDTFPKEWGVLQFAQHMRERSLSGEQTWMISNDVGEPCGIVCCQPMYPWAARLRGICFARGMMPPAQKREAVRQIIANPFSMGVEKMSAQYFAHNTRIAKFLTDLGFREEGYLKAETRQQGKPVDCVLVALHRESR